MEVGAFIIGSEIVSGKRKDKHMAHVIKALAKRGLELSWCQLVSNSPEVLTRLLKNSFSSSGSIVFSFGGIGCTPDDHTRACAAKAAKLKLVRNADAQRDIEAQFGKEAYPNRIRMADLPQGCDLIPNPINRCPGFSIRNHHFLPGFPHMSWPMMEWVLDNRYGDQLRDEKYVEYLINTHDAREDDLLDLMESFVKRFPDVHFASMPHVLSHRTDLEFGVRGQEDKVRIGMDWLTGELNARGFRWEARRHPKAPSPPSS